MIDIFMMIVAQLIRKKNEINRKREEKLINQEEERRGSGSVAVPISRGTLVQGEGGRVTQFYHYQYLNHDL